MFQPAVLNSCSKNASDLKNPSINMVNPNTRLLDNGPKYSLLVCIIYSQKYESTKVSFGGLHLKTTASCAMLFRDVTAMLMKPVMGHSLRELAKFKLPLVGSSVELGATHYRCHALAPARPKHARDAC